MLRITIEEKQRAVILRLEGQLIGPWVADVEQCWRNIFASRGEKAVQVDLSAVHFVDTAGGALLNRMHDAGFRLADGRPTLPKDIRG
jgi:anti-anti-sigma regulatory factor